MSDEKESDHNYEPGDKVRCLSPEWPGKYSHYLEVGAIYTIEMITDEGNIFVEEQIGRYYPRQFELCGCSEKENDMSDEKKSDHDYDPEKIRGAIQDYLYCEPESLGDEDPPKSAEEIEDDVKVFDLYEDTCRIFFCVMGSWFSLDVDRGRIENDPTAAEDVVAEGTARTVHGDEIDKIGFSDTTTIIFKDGSKVVCRDCSWEAL